ncbi:scm-like with four MBT domains protein 2 isoform X2 [Perognathus longimembris pacificus]|uniref:scm-like with four MBT domains protein 2 isoform X2 n=1 Tax=Perognathus longimembris pacificus TaxID=214514 RepID=UPI002019C8BE|nr:scm-like with four MBT domains protein 2 isoform X2 [Perognathus longimembris pacificus]
MEMEILIQVEISIQSNFQPGMKLEVANKNNPDTYWVATIITTCGQLLLLRYCGYGEDRRADFWCDMVIADLHPVGWCTQNNKILMPPDAAPHERLSPPSTWPPALPGPSAVFHTGPAPPAPAGTCGLGSASRPSG